MKQDAANANELQVRNAVDHIIEKERKLAQNENRKADLMSTMIKDEESN